MWWEWNTFYLNMKHVSTNLFIRLLLPELDLLGQYFVGCSSLTPWIGWISLWVYWFPPYKSEPLYLFQNSSSAIHSLFPSDCSPPHSAWCWNGVRIVDHSRRGGWILWTSFSSTSDFNPVRDCKSRSILHKLRGVLTEVKCGKSLLSLKRINTRQVNR